MANPVQQFEIQPLIPLHIGQVDVSFTNSSLWMMAAVVLATVVLGMASKKRALVPGRMQMLSESLYEFIANMIRDNIGSEGRRYFPLIFTLVKRSRLDVELNPQRRFPMGKRNLQMKRY